MIRWNQLSTQEKTVRYNLAVSQEEDFLHYSVNKYWGSYDDNPMAGIPEQELIFQFVQQQAAPYRAWLEHFEGLSEYNQDKTMASHWADPMLILEPETLGAVVVAEVINNLLSREVLQEDFHLKGGQVKFTYHRMAKNIGRAIQRIVAYRHTRANNREDWLKQSHFLKNWEEKRCIGFTKKFGGEIEWTSSQQADIGSHLLHLASLTGLVEIHNRKVKKNKTGWKKEKIVVFPEEIIQALTDKHAIQMMLHMVYKPMIVPPIDHTPELSGGALTLDLRKDTVDGQSVPAEADLDALNSMQQTEWTINTPVLDVMETMYKNNWEFCNLPPKNLDKVMFPSIADDLPAPEKAKLINERAELWGQWFKDMQKRMQTEVRITLARQMDSLSFFYHSYTMDFRGRAYSTCTMLSPQSGDFDRGLIKFATPVQQTPEGFYWQKVALANAMDGAEGWEGEASDKASFDDRVAWVDANHDMLLVVADDPLEHAAVWCDNDTKKKNPSFQRLASILDYAEAVREGTTSYPVQLDGACNGSQHWSAIRRDPAIAKLTNVAPGDKPQDLYQYVADIASDEMERKAGDNEWCEKFIDHWGRLKRKVVKRATMCDAYGITPHGIRKYAREEGHLSWVAKEDLAGAVNELAALTIHGLNGAMTKSNEGKEYVRTLSDLCSEHEKPLVWTTDTGFKVIHTYQTYEPRMSKSQLYGKKYVLKTFFGEGTGLTDPKAAYTGIAPNYIHSHDAAHMKLCINEMADAGITQFSMIHDSFGCPAPQVPIMRQIIRERFHAQHEHIQLDKLKADVEQHLDVECPEPPAPGDFDIGVVLRSEYLFG